MKKTKLISYVLALTMANSLVLPAYKASAVELNPNGSVLEIPSNEDINKNIIELPSKESFIRNWSVIDESGSTHSLSINYKSMIMTIDGEEIQFNVEEISNEVSTFATVDWSTGAKVTGKIPWKGSVILLSAAIAGFVSGGSAAGWAATIAGAITADAENIYFSFVQYQSKEKYWSSYDNVYYKKCINKDITFYESSLNGRILCGPNDGSWFDPIRPR